jgi:hypothetical protein
MEIRSIKVAVNKEYITSDRWKCNKSPGGSHHWIINGYQMTCKYCNDSKSASTTGAGMPEIN